jgi:hypothetical protein
MDWPQVLKGLCDSSHRGVPDFLETAGDKQGYFQDLPETRLAEVLSYARRHIRAIGPYVRPGALLLRGP